MENSVTEGLLPEIFGSYLWGDDEDFAEGRKVLVNEFENNG